jgi:hypothetical protein
MKCRGGVVEVRSGVIEIHAVDVLHMNEKEKAKSPGEEIDLSCEENSMHGYRRSFFRNMTNSFQSSLATKNNLCKIFISFSRLSRR